MEVIFQLNGHLQELLANKSETHQNLKKILEEIEDRGLNLQPVSFSGQSVSSSFYRLETENISLANKIIDDLHNNPLVDAAYIKPTDELPNL